LEKKMEIKSTQGLHSEQVKMLVYGQSGIGKTSLLGTMPERETLIVSAESGLLCLADKSIDVVEVKSYDAVRAAYAFLQKNEDEGRYKYIAIDSLTEISDLVVKSLKNREEYKNPSNALKMWGEFNDTMIGLVKAFRDLPRHVVFSALSDDVNDGGIITKHPLISGNKAQKLLSSFFDEVFFLTINQDNEREVCTQPTHQFIAKDRSGKLASSEAPNLNDIINKIQGK
jgi:phage nucleotide-binding protein